MPSSQGSPMGFLVMLVCGVAVYIFYCYCLKRVVEKCGGTPGGLIWVPLLQMIPLFRVAKMNPWLILLLFVPLANLIVLVMVWLNVLKILGRHPAMVIVMLLFGFIYLPVLAFSSGGAVPATA